MNDGLTNINIRDILNYKLHITVLVIFLISTYIGVIRFSLFDTITIIILPLVFSLFLSLFAYTSKRIEWIQKKESQTATLIFTVIICPLIAKLAIVSGANIHLLYQTGPLLILEELGDILCVLVAMPIAILLGFRRKSVGMASSICREPQMAVIINRYGADSEEMKGLMIVYSIGIVLGTVFMSLIVNIMSYLLPLHPYAYAIACAIGSTSMNVAGLSALCVLYPDISNQLMAFSAIANLISVLLSVYIFMFLLLPLAERIYSFLEGYQ